MAELDKFKRRIIRTVARMKRVEKKSEEEIWAELKKETKCDCKLLWERMRSLTLKKMKRLLIAEDKLDNIIPVARMSLTDWLLFDLVLVHEDIDVIGEDLGVTDLRPLADLLAIVEKFKIEGKQGESLAKAWTAATIDYNNEGRQCSPMLLQRRWYQLKKVSRTRFYEFWAKYRGVSKLLEDCKKQVPISRLKMNVAQRYPHIIIKPFEDWDKLIEHRFIILPEEIEKNIKSKLPPDAKDSGDVDIVLLEPNVETIDLSDAESHSDNSKSNETKMDVSISELPNKQVVIKTEPVEVTEIIDKEKLAKERDAMLLGSIPDIDDEVCGIETDNFNDDSVGSDIEMNTEYEKTTDSNNDNVMIETKIDTAFKKTAIVINETEKSQDMCIENTDASILQQEDIEDVEVKSEDTCLDKYDEGVEIDNDLMSEQNESIVMPQIANVFGNVNVTEELGNVLTNVEKTQHTIQVNKELEPPPIVPLLEESLENTSTVIDTNNDDDSEINERLISYLQNNKRNQESKSEIVDINTLSNKEMSKKETINNEENPYLDIPIDLTFADDGIELLEDGIEYEDDEDIIKPIQDCDIKAERTISEVGKVADDDQINDDEDGNAKFDLKLLMQPVVYTTRLDEMTVFKNIKIGAVCDINVINNAFNESKPINKINQNFKEENDEAENDSTSQNISNGSDDSQSEHDMSEPDDLNIYDRVKLSSYLLQKPRSRSYNPIQLCKNPDFNTRLKQLTLGFLSSTRNRSFLRTLKPITIDVSKTFESKLFEGTMYLQSGEPNQKVEILDEVVKKPTSVIPSAMPVQSLIDNAVTQCMSSTLNPTKRLVDNTFPERSRVINLPDLDHVRKMNKRLFTAEITPMRIQQPNEKCVPPVQLVSSLAKTPPDKDSVISYYKDSRTEMKSGLSQSNLVPEHAKTVCKPMPKVHKEACLLEEPVQKSRPGPKSSSIVKKPPYNYYAACRSRPVRSAVTWLSKPIKPVKLYNDALLTIDTLNKMLNVMKNNSSEPEENISKVKAKKAKASLAKEKYELTIRLQEFENYLKEHSGNEIPKENDDKVQEEKSKEDTSSTDIEASSKAMNSKQTESKSTDSKPADTNLQESQKLKRKIGDYCCWARYQINFPKMKPKHKCPRICVCCCRQELIDTKLRVKSKDQVNSKIKAQREKWSHDKNEASTPLLPTQPTTPLKEKPQKTEISIQCDLPPLPTETPKEDPQTNSRPTETSNVRRNVIVIDATEEPEVTTENPTNIDISCKESVTGSVVRPRINVLPINSLITPKITLPLRSRYKTRSTEASVSYAPPKNNINAKSLQRQTNTATQQILAGPNNHSDSLMKEKFIYLNSKQKSNAETACPIFLGRNKILLTDVKLPSELDTISDINKPIKAQQVSSAFTIPEGVQLALQPDGQVTYSVDPAANLNAEKLASLRSIMTAIQEQLATPSPSSSNLEASQSTEVVNLIDEENLDEAKENSEKEIKTNTSSISLDNGTSSVAKDVENNSNSNNSIVLINNEDENSDNSALLVNQRNNIVNSSSIAELDSNKTESNETAEVPNIAKKENSHQLNNVDKNEIINNASPNKSNATLNKVVVTVSDATNENPEQIHDLINNKDVSSSPVGEVDKIDTENTNNITEIVTTTTNRNTLLSDLMEMSGISAEDTIPSEAPEIQSPPLIPVPQKSSPRYLQTAVNATPIITTAPSTNVKELNSITSFSQLKYACENNGSFFKLDLNTGSITPISVCIKRNLSLTTKPLGRVATAKPKAVIDLTNDHNSSDECEPAADENELPAFIISKPTQSLLKGTYHLPNSAKPLKIFKSSNVLRRKERSKVDKHVTDTPKSFRVPSDIISQIRKRKQELDSKTLLTEDSLESLDVDEYLWSDDNSLNESSESSDDEPLAVKAKRMRMNEKNETDSTNINNQNVEQNKSVTQSNSTQETPESIMEISSELPNENLNEKNDINKDDCEGYTEITFLSDHESDDSNDDCILGV